MSLLTPSRARRALFFVSAFFAVLCVAIVVMLVARVDGPLIAMGKASFWPGHIDLTEITPFARLSQSVVFGLFGGWSVGLALLAKRASVADLERAAKPVMIGLAVWYVLDSAGSIASGATANAVANTVYLVLIGVPLWRLMRGSGSRRSAEISIR